MSLLSLSQHDWLALARWKGRPALLLGTPDWCWHHLHADLAREALGTDQICFDNFHVRCDAVAPAQCRGGCSPPHRASHQDTCYWAPVEGALLTPVHVASQAQQCIVCGLQTSDALLAYGPLVANHYGASFSLLAWSGAGILRKGGPQLACRYHTPACDL